MADEIVSYKGFNKDWTCRDYQFAVGQTYEHDGKVVACATGFHACEHPLDVFGYYAPAESVFAEVRQSGAISRHSDDTKIASARITITAEIGLHDMIARAVKYVFDRAKWTKSTEATAEGEAASATGTSGAASATGTSGAASATGNSGAASATGNSGAASATGNSGAASATGKHSVAMVSGYNGRALGADGCALFLVERNDNHEIVAAWAGIVGRDGIKADTWYRLRNGKPEEVA